MSKRGYCCVGLWQPKNASNIGSILRASGCFGVDLVAVEGRRYSNSATDTQKAWKHIPFLETESLLSLAPKGCTIVAVDLVPNAHDLRTYCHPERAFYIFGGEDRTLDESILSKANQRVMIPSAHCLNLAACVSIVLYDRLAKNGD